MKKKLLSSVAFKKVIFIGFFAFFLLTGKSLTGQVSNPHCIDIPEDCPIEVRFGVTPITIQTLADFQSYVGEIVTFSPDKFLDFATDFKANDDNYRTVAPKVWKTNEDGYYLWEDFIWAKYVGGNTYDGSWQIIEESPPRKASPRDKKLRIYIDFCHKVKENKGLDYKNNVNLIVCGELQIGELVAVSSVPEVELITFYNECITDVDGNITCRFLGNVLFSEIIVTETGFWIAEEGVDIFSNFEDNKVPIYEIEISEFPFAFPQGLEFYYSFIQGRTYQIYAYAINGLGIGISEVSYFPSPPQGKNIENEKNHFFKTEGDLVEEDPVISGFNNLTLTLCCSTSVLKIDILKVGNNTNLNINGTFFVDLITGWNPGQGIDGTSNNFCITGTGVILTTDGYVPDIYNLSYSNSCEGFDGTLPIELLSFTQEVKPDRVILNWTTGTEINNDYFTLERSRDMYGWEVLGFVPGAGNSSVPLSYSFSDMRPIDGLAYYRLKQTDFDGKFEYFGPIAAHYDLGMEGLDFKVLKQYTNWVIAVPNDGIYQVEVYNLMGHRMISEITENTLTIPAPQGAVVIRVTDGFTRSASRVVM